MTFIDYLPLDAAKLKFIEACRRTINFASDLGYVLKPELGASANGFVFHNPTTRMATIVPEGLGTADDARPDDLTSEELTAFWYNIAFKVMAALTNDCCSSGFRPVLLGLYLPCATPDVFTEEFLKGFLDGIVEGCRKVGAVYLGGETPQLISKMQKGSIDIAGAVMGITDKVIDNSKLSPGDYIISFASSGPHENGFTSLRSLADKLPDGYHTKLPDGTEYWQAINAPSILYSPIIQSALAAGINLTNLEVISGHGWQKVMRSKQPLQYNFDEILPVTQIFDFVRDAMEIDDQKLFATFNCGTGMVAFTKDLKDGEKLLEIAGALGIKGMVSGQVAESSTRLVNIKPRKVVLEDEMILSK